MPCLYFLSSTVGLIGKAWRCAQEGSHVWNNENLSAARYPLLVLTILIGESEFLQEPRMRTGDAGTPCKGSRVMAG